MLEIDIRKVDKKTLEKYNDFSRDVGNLLAEYEQNDGERLKKVAEKMGITKTDTGWVKSETEKNDIDWDIGISLRRGENNVQQVPVSLLLAYEYSLATERITHGKVKFEDALNELFNREQKFRIGNPEKGRDDQCLYGKTYDDETAVPVSAKAYRVVCSNGAQHLSYFQDGKLHGAVFLFAKEIIDDFAKNEKGESVPLIYEGIEFEKIGKYGDMSLLTYFRQTAFHEWTHSMERDFLDADNPEIKETYEGVDGKTYSNFQSVKKYTTSENIGEFEEEVIITGDDFDRENVMKYKISQTDPSTQEVKTYSASKKVPEDKLEIKIGLEKKELDKTLCISSGLETFEVTPEGIEMHNQVTEGFVEATARAMVYAIAPDTKDLDEGRYFEKVEMAKKVFEARDEALGNGPGQTYADFLTHSAVLKKELESIEIDKEDGTKVDGLHYISDYADEVHERRTPKRRMYNTIMKAINNGKIDKKNGELIKQMDISAKAVLTPAEQQELKRLAIAGGIDSKFADPFVDDLAKDMEKEKEFFDGIPEKLGYRKKDYSDAGGASSGLIQSAVEATEEHTKTSDINAQVEIIKNNQKEIIQDNEQERDD